MYKQSIRQGKASKNLLTLTKVTNWLAMTSPKNVFGLNVQKSRDQATELLSTCTCEYNFT